jgi:hypothetical protein
MAITVTPESDIVFKLLENSTSCREHITIKNNDNDQSIAFKIKTTAPRHFSVKPSSGIIEPGASVNVIVLYQYKHDDESLKRKEKFQIRTIKIPGAVLLLEQDVQGGKIMDLWAQADDILKNNPESGPEIMGLWKLRCIIVPFSTEPVNNLGEIRKDDERVSVYKPVQEDTPGI